jgi:hypothetical protein
VVEEVEDLVAEEEEVEEVEEVGLLPMSLIIITATMTLSSQAHLALMDSMDS